MRPSDWFAKGLGALTITLVTTLGLAAGGVARATSGPQGSGVAPVPSAFPPQTHGEQNDAGPLARLTAARAAQEATPPPRLAAHVAAETLKLDASYPSQAPGATPGPGVPVWRQLGPSNVIHQRIDGYTGSVQFKASETARVRKILVDPRNSNVVYVLFGAGGLWKTTDFLSQQPTWVPLTDRLESVSSGSIAFGSSPDTLYLGLGDPWDSRPTLGGLMYKSTDGGQTWSQPLLLPGAAVVNDIAVDTSGPQDIVMVATDVGLFRSVDGGQTYGSVQGAPSDDPSTTVDDQLFHGTVAWSIVRTSLGWVLEATNGGMLDFGSGFLAYSTDHGATWTADRNDGVHFDWGSRATLAVGAAGDHVVYAFQGWAYPYQQYQRDVFRSADGGLTWTALNTTSTAPVNPTPETPQVWVAFYQAWYDQLIWVDPTDSSRRTVFIGGDFYTAKTTDAGASWRMMTQWLGAYGLPYLHTDDHTAAFVPGKNPLLVVGNDGGLAISGDGGATWSFDKNVGIDAASLYGLASTPANPQEVIIGTQDTGTLIRQGNTGAFNQVIGGDGFVPAIGQANGTVSLGSVYQDLILRSVATPQNQVNKWTVSNGFDDDGYFLTPLVAASAAADPSGLCFYTYTQHKVLRTTDGGLTWTPILSVNPSGPPTVRYSTMNLAVDPKSIDGVIIGDYGGLVHITHDGGATWTTSKLLGVAGYRGFNDTVAWAPGGVLYVGSESLAFGSLRVMRSTDSGATWSAAGAGLPDVPVTKLAPDLSDPTGRTIYAATWIGVFRTTNGGASWSLFGAGLPHVDVTDLYVSPDGSLVRAGTYGRGVWEVTVG